MLDPAQLFSTHVSLTVLAKTADKHSVNSAEGWMMEAFPLAH